MMFGCNSVRKLFILMRKIAKKLAMISYCAMFIKYITINSSVSGNLNSSCVQIQFVQLIFSDTCHFREKNRTIIINKSNTILFFNFSILKYENIEIDQSVEPRQSNTNDWNDSVKLIGTIYFRPSYGPIYPVGVTNVKNPSFFLILQHHIFYII